MAETLTPNCSRGPLLLPLKPRFPTARRLRFLPSSSLSGVDHDGGVGFSPLSLQSQKQKFRRAAATPSTAVYQERDPAEEDEESMSIDALHRFINLNLGKWNGSFYVSIPSLYLPSYLFRFRRLKLDFFGQRQQFDAHGNVLQSVTTRLAASSYGEGDLISLIQTLYIKEPPLGAPMDHDEPEWFEYKIKETNMFTVDKYQQIGFFPGQKAFSLRYQTAGMLEAVLRAGVLGEDDTGEESPRNLKVPSRQPSVVCENCLYSLRKDMRARAFHIMDPKGFLEMLIVFLEERDGVLFTSCDSFKDSPNRLTSMLGRWEGHSLTKRSGVYGATIAAANTVALLEMDDKGQLIQDITSTAHENGTKTNVHWTGTVSDNLVIFDGGYQVTLLPGGMYMGCPCDIGKSVAQSQSFHLEFCWMESPEKRQRLVRTYDMEGLAVSSTYFSEIKI